MVRLRPLFVLALLVIPPGASASAQWFARAQRHNFVEYGVPDTGYQPTAYYGSTTLALPPSAYARRATPGGLIETAARRANPFTVESVERANRGIAFAPSVYRQPANDPYRAARPLFGRRALRPSYAVPAPAAVPVTPAQGCASCWQP